MRVSMSRGSDDDIKGKMQFTTKKLRHLIYETEPSSYIQSSWHPLCGLSHSVITTKTNQVEEYNT